MRGYLTSCVKQKNICHVFETVFTDCALFLLFDPKSLPQADEVEGDELGQGKVVHDKADEAQKVEQGGHPPKTAHVEVGREEQPKPRNDCGKREVKDQKL